MNNSQANNLNSTNEENLLSEKNHKAELAFFTLLFILALLLNLVVILCYFKTAKRTTHLKLLLNLCITNIIGTAITFLYGKGDEWLFKQNVCFALLSIDTCWTVLCLSSTALVVSECLVSTIQQYKKRPLQETFTNFKLTLVLVWVGAGILAMITFMLLQRSTDQNLCYMYQHYRHDLYSAFLYSFVIAPMLSFLVIEFLIFKAKRKHEKSIEVEEPPENISIDLRNNTGAFHLSHLLLLNWLPYTLYVILLMNWGVQRIYFKEITYKMLKTLTFFRCMSCLLQPLVIIYFNHNIKEAARRVCKNIEVELLGEEIKTNKRKRRIQKRNMTLASMEYIIQPEPSPTISSAEIDSET